jgi:hypothetical protein
MEKEKIVKKVITKMKEEEKVSTLKIEIKNEVNRIKLTLQNFILKKEFEKFNAALINFASDWKILNDQNQFGDLLQEVADWKLDLSEDYKKNLMQLGKKYNVLGIKFKH